VRENNTMSESGFTGLFDDVAVRETHPANPQIRKILIQTIEVGLKAFPPCRKILFLDQLMQLINA